MIALCLDEIKTKESLGPYLKIFNNSVGTDARFLNVYWLWFNNKFTDPISGGSGILENQDGCGKKRFNNRIVGGTALSKWVCINIPICKILMLLRAFIGAQRVFTLHHVNKTYFRHEYPWLCSLRKGARHICGVTVISIYPKPTIIVGAAHCVNPNSKQRRMRPSNTYMTYQISFS